jgi:hypothetical protein
MNSKTRIITIILLLTTFFSFSVFAEVPTPGELIPDLLQFIKDLFAGTTDIASAYLISQILFFILFLAIFMEGLRALPIFGYKGEVNKQGKVFAVAASALSTLAIFIIDYTTQVSTTERLNALLAPFGVWGGLAIAGIMCYITFKLIYDSDALKEQVMLAIAIAASVGITFAGFLLSLNNLVGWGFLIMLLALLVGAIVAFAKWKKDGGSFRSGGSGGSGGDGTDDDDGERPPGQEPPNSPRKKHPSDPPTPTGPVPPGIVPHGPKPTAPPLPKRPPIPDKEEIFIDLSPKFNNIRCQDGLGACTAFAATSIFEYILQTGYKFPKKELSPLFLWYKTRETIGSTKSNTGPRTCVIPMKNLADSGVCLEEVWPFEDSSSNKWKTEPSNPAKNDAFSKKIGKYYSLDKNDPDQWVYELRGGNPINIGVHFPSDMSYPYKNKFYDNFNPPSGGGHAMVIVGYHSHYPYKGKGIKAFKIRNSHGIDWGNNGYTWVPAETLKKILAEDLLVIKGWQKDEPKKDLQKLKISGRVVFDPDDKLDLNKSTGKQIYDAELEGFETGHKFHVGVMAQIKGKLVPPLKEIEIDNKKDTSGRFELEFEADPSQFEQIKHKINGINLKKQPAGVIVYKRTEGKKEVYFHIVSFKKSFAGRGGEGTTYSDNPRSNLVKGNEKLKFSGRPITFNKDHTHEKNVIIPIFGPHEKEPEEIIDDENKKKLTKTLKKVKKLAVDEKGATAALFKYSQELKELIEQIKLEEDVTKRELKKAEDLVRYIGRSERTEYKFEKRLKTELKKLIEELFLIKGTEIYVKTAEKIYEDIERSNKYILTFDSRYTGQIKKIINQLKLEHIKLTDNKKEKGKIKKNIDDLWNELLNSMSKIIRWSNGIQVRLNDLIEFEEHIKKVEIYNKHINAIKKNPII